MIAVKESSRVSGDFDEEDRIVTLQNLVAVLLRTFPHQQEVLIDRDLVMDAIDAIGIKVPS